LNKLVCDALNKVAYHDDSEVCRGPITKHWTADYPRTIIELSYRPKI